MKFLIEYWPLILGVAVMIFGYVLLILLPQLRENDVKNVYQHAGEPRIIWQNSELEKDYWTRFEREKMRYIDSRNRWATVQTPVIPFPMNCAFEHEWFGKKYHVSTVGLSYAEYMRAGQIFYQKMQAIWDKEVYGEHGMKTMMETTKKQIPVDPDKIWQNAN